MKVLKYLVALVAGAMAFTACEKDPADLYAVEATAPVMDAHADILLTENSLSETLTFSWKEARGMGDEVMYTLYATLDGQEVSLTTTNNTYFTAGKEAFRTQLLTGFGIEPNDNFSIGMYVAADNGQTVVKSEAITMNVFVYGDYVPAIVSVAETAQEGVVLTETMTENVELITWTAARFEYGVNPLYKVEILFNEGQRVELASGLTATSYAASPSTLNSALIALGCPKDAASDVQFIVTSYLDGEGAAQLESTAVTVKITTYTPSYPETLSLVGDFGGLNWGDTAATSPVLKGDPNTGVYHGLVSYYGATWGMKVYYLHPKTEEAQWVGGTTEDGVTYTIGTAIGDNIAPEQGSYVVYVDLSKGTMTLGKIESIGLIGSATANGWDAQTNFEYNAETGLMEIKAIELGEGAYKVRVNDNWGNPWEDPTAYNLGGDPADMTFGGADIASEPGVYDVTMNLASNANYALTFTKTGDVVIEDPMTKNYGLVGTINNWGETADLVFEAVEGEEYKVVKNVTLTESDQIKIRVDQDWNENYGGEGETEPYVLAVDTKVTLVAGGKNISMAAGSYDLYFYPKTKELIAVAAGAGLPTPTAAYGVIGAFNGWADDVLMEAANNGYYVAKAVELTLVDQPNNGFKIREPGNWDVNWGSGTTLELGVPTAVYHNGGNIGLASEGSYDIYFNPEKTLVIVVTAGADDPTGAEAPTPTETVYSVAGDFNSWGDTDMTDNGDGYFVLKGQAVAAGNGFKFKKNHSWADGDCWGVDAAVVTATTVGEAITLVQPGANIPVPAEGTFDIYFNPTTGVAYVMNQGEVPGGSTTPAAHTYNLAGTINSWNQADTTYTLTAAGTDTYTISNIALEAYAEFKICEDYAWTVSYGVASGATVVLDQKFAVTSNNGGNIVMPASGTFNITFYAATSEVLIEAVGDVTYPMPEGQDITVGLVGDMTNWADDVLFTKQSGGIYTIDKVTLTTAQGFKVRKAGAWENTFNWGLAVSGTLTTGVDTDLICDGGSGNMYVAEDGDYKITFTPATDDKGVIPAQPAKIKVEKVVEEPVTPSTPSVLEWGSSLF